jgi:hypothetical protein
LIGWKPHAHARDAVVAARRWLVAAERVTVLCVNDKPDGNYQFTARELLDQLGVKGDVVAISPEGRPVGEAVLDFANSAHATCLLVGVQAQLFPPTAPWPRHALPAGACHDTVHDETSDGWAAKSIVVSFRRQP